jgi:hypothetical protein
MATEDTTVTYSGIKKCLLHSSIMYTLHTVLIQGFQTRVPGDSTRCLLDELIHNTNRLKKHT